MIEQDSYTGKAIEGFDIESLIATERGSKIYKAFHPEKNIYASVKIISTAYLSSTDSEYAERFVKETRTISGLTHPNIVTVYGYGEMDGLYYLVTEYSGDDTLRTLLAGDYPNRNALFKQVLPILQQIADALDYIHSREIIHRDVKPESIMLAPEERAVLTNFGLALKVPEGTMGTSLGSVRYIAPEVAMSSANAVPESDQYSLGIIAYEVLTGQVPFESKSELDIVMKQFKDPPPPLNQFNPHITPATEEAIKRVLDKKPENRFASCKEFINTLVGSFGETGLTTQEIQLDEGATLLPPTVQMGDSPSRRLEQQSPDFGEQKQPRESRTRTRPTVVFQEILNRFRRKRDQDDD